MNEMNGTAVAEHELNVCEMNEKNDSKMIFRLHLLVWARRRSDRTLNGLISEACEGGRMTITTRRRNAKCDTVNLRRVR